MSWTKDDDDEAGDVIKGKEMHDSKAENYRGGQVYIFEHAYNL